MQGFDCEGCEVSVRFKTFISWHAFLMQCEKVFWKEEQQQNKIHQNWNYDWLTLVLVLSCPIIVV